MQTAIPVAVLRHPMAQTVHGVVDTPRFVDVDGIDEFFKVVRRRVAWRLSVKSWIRFFSLAWTVPTLWTYTTTPASETTTNQPTHPPTKKTNKQPTTHPNKQTNETTTQPHEQTHERTNKQSTTKNNNALSQARSYCSMVFKFASQCLRPTLPICALSRRRTSANMDRVTDVPR